MNVPVLTILLGEQVVGQLFRYEPENADPIMRFVADDAFARLPLTQARVLSIGMRGATVDAQRAIWQDLHAQAFNARYVQTRAGHMEWQLPAWFQGLLPEGLFRDHVARAAGCAPDDHFGMLVACGKGLPGNVRALWKQVPREELQRLVTQDNDALEMNVTAEPVQDAISLSGVQPKLAVIRQHGRYVGRTHLEETHIIAKLPTPDHPRMPQVEDLSLRLAAAAGVTTCEHVLEPLGKLLARHDYDLGDEEDPGFLAIERFDRSPAGRIHVETMLQAFDMPPADKYSGNYLDMAGLLLGLPRCGEPAVHEMLRRLAVNEMLGNVDAHMANWGLVYRNGFDAELAPAYDVVAHSAWMPGTGHALRILPPEEADGVPEPQSILRPTTLRRFCDRLKMQERPAAMVVRRAVDAAHKQWPALIAAAAITATQKARLMARLQGLPGGPLGRPKRGQGGAPAAQP